MRNLLLTSVMLLFSVLGVNATVDPNFHIYLCFGQSNMEGNATPEAIDYQNVDENFKMLACVNFQNPARTMGQWYTATPPIVRQGTGLGMADYFGRTMVANQPGIKVGVVDVAIGGTKIEGFMQEEVAAYIASMDPQTEGWLINYFAAYDNDPYKRLVDMAKIAQQSGVIKGILLHQGESNNMQQDWPQKVKTVYDRLITDLNLNAADVPLFVGETVRSEMGGYCGGHNGVIANVPSVIPNSYVISSANCPQRGDGLHFTAQGYRIMGQRYAQKALSLKGIEIEVEEPTLPASAYQIDKKFTSLSEIGTTSFAIVNEAESSVFYCSDMQNLKFGLYADAFNNNNMGFVFKLEPCSDVANGYFLHLYTPNGDGYVVYGTQGYLNSQPTDGWCSFILGLTGNQGQHNGQDIDNGAVWYIDYSAGNGFSLKNAGTGKYLKDAGPAKYDTPTYFQLCTLKAATGIEEVSLTPAPSPKGEGSHYWYTLDGRKLNSQPTERGIYIVNGKKVVMK